jgi:hypothetical protein
VSDGRKTHPLMALLLEQNSFVGSAETVENEIMPLDSQLNLKPGDAALLAAANTPLERDFGIVQVIDPEKHAEEFPDWEERLLNSYLLCRHFSKDDPEITTGWFSRLKLLPIKNYRWREARTWLKKGFPDEPPGWCGDVYRHHTDQLALQAPTVVPRLTECPHCHGRKVHLHVERTMVYDSLSGVVKDPDGSDKYVNVTEPEESSSHVAKLICQDCGSEATMTDDEWLIGGYTN